MVWVWVRVWSEVMEKILEYGCGRRPGWGIKVKVKNRGMGMGMVEG
jgi:hypothetical protein